MHSIASRYLATRGNNKILHTHSTHIISSEEILPRLTRCTRTHTRTNKSPFLISYFRIVGANLHPPPPCSLCKTYPHNTRDLFNCTHIRTTWPSQDLWTYPDEVTALLTRWTVKLVDHKWKDRTPPTSNC